ncbi:hypothetical protein AALC17_05150, partial [Oscillospiraceae bacterium 38-13]
NTVVKLVSAHNTWLATAREDRWRQHKADCFGSLLCFYVRRTLPMQLTPACSAFKNPIKIIPAFPVYFQRARRLEPVHPQQLLLPGIQQENFRLPIGQLAVKTEFVYPAFPKPADMPDPAGTGVQDSAVPVLPRSENKHYSGDALCRGKTLPYSQ